MPCPVARGFDKGRSPDAPPGPWRRLTSHTIEGALARFHTDVTWTGTIQPSGMGLGTSAANAPVVHYSSDGCGSSVERAATLHPLWQAGEREQRLLACWAWAKGGRR